jgi:hypothetical protein
MVVHDAISMGLDFDHGKEFSKKVWRAHRRKVHPSPGFGAFTLVVSFGRASFRLDEDRVAIALESVIGGFCGDLNIKIIQNRVFSFSVSCKSVGFMVVGLRDFVCPQFKCFFHLWGFGGPNWRREFLFWQRECAGEWIIACHKKDRRMTRATFSRSRRQSVHRSRVFVLVLDRIPVQNRNVLSPACSQPALASPANPLSAMPSPVSP